MPSKKYILREGVVLRPYGVNSHLDNDNLTDAIAKLLIKNGKANEKDFLTKTKRKNGNS